MLSLDPVYRKLNISVNKHEKINDLIWYIPELTDDDIKEYISMFGSLENIKFLDTVIKVQEEKNTKYDPNIRKQLIADQEFSDHYDKEDHLLKLSPQYFSNKKIKNFLKNHTTVVAENEVTVFRQPLEYVGIDDLAYNPEGLYFKDYFLEVHPYIKTNTEFRIDFVENYGKYHKQDTTFSIAINAENLINLDQYRRVGLDEGLIYGKSYSDKLFSEDVEKGYPIKLIRDQGLEDVINNDIQFTEIFINIDNSIQIEELVAWKDSLVVNRYVHCMFDKDSQKITHFDGSLLYYKPDKYRARLEKNLAKKPKDAFMKRKIFKIDKNRGSEDGGISISDWKNILYTFLKGNEMVLEYFDPFSYQDYLTQIKLTPKESWDIFIEEDKKFAQKALEQNYERYRCDFSFLKDESRK